MHGIFIRRRASSIEEEIDFIKGYDDAGIGYPVDKYEVDNEYYSALLAESSRIQTAIKVL